MKKFREFELHHRNLESGKVDIGTIFSASWGYDQTNITFYEVVHRTKAFVTVREIANKIVSYTEYYTSEVIPDRSKFKSDRIRVKLRDSYIKINSFIYANVWDGRTEHATSYA